MRLEPIVRKHYEVDCTECAEGILQWCEYDEIAICDCCDKEINLNDYCQEYWDRNCVEY